VAAIDAIVTATSRLSLTNLEAWEGKLRAELWKSKQVPSFSVRKFWRRPTRFVSWLDLSHSDGFKREEALRALYEGAPNGFFFSLAVRRLNDWVPQVRAAARDNLPLIAKRSDPEHVVDALWKVLPHCSSWGRMEDADRQVLTDLVCIEGVTFALKSRIVSATAGPTTAIFAQAGRTPALDRWLSEIAKNAIQPSVRAKAYRCQLEGRMVWVAGRKWAWTDLRWCEGRFEPILGVRPLSLTSPFLEVLKMALADRSPIVRRVAGDLLIQQLEIVGTEAVNLAKLLASDDSPSVAERGRFALAQLSARP
jgi:hypothetical protein